MVAIAQPWKQVAQGWATLADPDPYQELLCLAPKIVSCHIKVFLTMEILKFPPSFAAISAVEVTVLP